MIGKILSKPVDSDHLVRILSRKWNPNGDLEVIPFVDGHITSRLSNKEDMYRVLTGGPWTVSGAALDLEEWRENFNPNHDTVSKVTMWILLLGLSNK